MTSPEYTVGSYTYDSFRRPASMSYTDSTQPDMVKEAYTYTYDKNSRLIQETLQNLYPEKEEDRQDEVRSYTYNARGQLIQTDVKNQLDPANSYITSYTYDAVGNRLTQEKVIAGQEETTQYTYNSLNQLLTSVTKKADGTATASKTYQYDANGSQISEADSISKKETVNTYDPAGRLASCTIKQNGQTTLQQNNKYNGSGARIQKSENGQVTNYFYSQGSVLYTEDGNGKETSLNLHGVAGNMIATARKEGAAEGYYYYHKDPAGSTTNLRDVDGKSVVSYQYTDFGETSIYGDTDFYNEICYNEAVYDKSTGLYYLNARYYDPTDGRFISRDSYRGSLKNPSTQHLYAYCANNPVNYEDPSGHIAISRIVGGIVGATAGFLGGRAIAKKTNAKGWKKWAIIAGCTVGGVAVGAIAGPRVAKAAKKVVKYVKKKLPTRNVKTKVSKPNVKRTSNITLKKPSKVKKAVSKGKPKSTKIQTKRKMNHLGGKGGSNFKGQTYKGTRKPEIDFVNSKGKSTLTKHASKHGYVSPEEYLKDARNFLEKQPTSTIQSFVSSEGTYFRYDTATNEFGIINQYGGISTYFKLEKWMTYWLEQIEKYVLK